MPGCPECQLNGRADYLLTTIYLNVYIAAIMSRFPRFKPKASSPLSYSRLSDDTYDYVVAKPISLLDITDSEPVTVGLGTNQCPLAETMQASPTQKVENGRQTLRINCASFRPTPAIEQLTGVCALKAFSMGYAPDDFRIPLAPSLTDDMLRSLACPFVLREASVIADQQEVPVLTDVCPPAFSSDILPMGDIRRP